MLLISSSFDYYAIINSGFLIIVGVGFMIYYKKLGKMATQQRSKFMGVEYGKDVKSFNQKMFFIAGIVFILSGIYQYFYSQ